MDVVLVLAKDTEMCLTETSFVHNWFNRLGKSDHSSTTRSTIGLTARMTSRQAVERSTSFEMEKGKECERERAREQEGEKEKRSIVALKEPWKIREVTPGQSATPSPPPLRDNSASRTTPITSPRRSTSRAPSTSRVSTTVPSNNTSNNSNASSQQQDNTSDLGQQIQTIQKTLASMTQLMQTFRDETKAAIAICVERSESAEESVGKLQGRITRMERSIQGLWSKLDEYGMSFVEQAMDDMETQHRRQGEQLRTMRRLVEHQNSLREIDQELQEDACQEDYDQEEFDQEA